MIRRFSTQTFPLMNFVPPAARSTPTLPPFTALMGFVQRNCSSRTPLNASFPLASCSSNGSVHAAQRALQSNPSIWTTPVAADVILDEVAKKGLNCDDLLENVKLLLNGSVQERLAGAELLFSFVKKGKIDDSTANQLLSCPEEKCDDPDLSSAMHQSRRYLANGNDRKLQQPNASADEVIKEAQKRLQLYITWTPIAAASRLLEKRDIKSLLKGSSEEALAGAELLYILIQNEAITDEEAIELAFLGLEDKEGSRAIAIDVSGSCCKSLQYLFEKKGKELKIVEIARHKLHDSQTPQRGIESLLEMASSKRWEDE